MSGEVAIPEDIAERFEDSLEREHRANATCSRRW